MKHVRRFLVCMCAIAASTAMADGSYYYILTTTNVIGQSTQLTNFVAHKQSIGMEVHVVSNTAWGAGTGDTAANNIRTWLQQNYTNASGSQVIDYVLLIGNPNPTSDLPMKVCYPGFEDANADRPTDFFYAELTCNWDGDADGRYGEWNEDFNLTNDTPTASELYVGRIPYYDSISDLDAILAKIIAYETASTTNVNWRTKAILAMDHNDLMHDTERLGDWIKLDALLPSGFGYHRLYDRDLGFTPETIPCVSSNVLGVWATGQHGAIFWFSHGSETSTGGQIIDLSDVVNLSNAHPVFTFQGSCWNAKPEATDNLAYALLKTGAVCTVGSTRPASFMCVGMLGVPVAPIDPWAQPGHSPGFVFGYARNLVRYGYPAAKALQSWKAEQNPMNSSGPTASWADYLGFNVYGCPASSVYTCSTNVFLGPKWSQ